MLVHVETPIFPTEDPQKVVNALLNIFPDLVIKIEQENNKVVGTTNNLNRFKELLKEQKIRVTARSILMSKRIEKENKIVFNLNKQVATVGKVNFAEDLLLGTITVRIESNDIEKLIDDITKVRP